MAPVEPSHHRCCRRPRAAGRHTSPPSTLWYARTEGYRPRTSRIGDGDRRGHLGEEVVALVVDHDARGEVDDLDVQHCHLDELGVLETLTLVATVPPQSC